MDENVSLNNSEQQPLYEKVGRISFYICKFEKTLKEESIKRYLYNENIAENNMLMSVFFLGNKYKRKFEL